MDYHDVYTTVDASLIHDFLRILCHIQGNEVREIRGDFPSARPGNDAQFDR